MRELNDNELNAVSGGAEEVGSSILQILVAPLGFALIIAPLLALAAGVGFGDFINNLFGTNQANN